MGVVVIELWWVKEGRVVEGRVVEGRVVEGGGGG
jgi:hypothetical protein